MVQYTPIHRIQTIRIQYIPFVFNTKYNSGLSIQTEMNPNPNQSLPIQSSAHKYTVNRLICIEYKSIPLLTYTDQYKSILTNTLWMDWSVLNHYSNTSCQYSASNSESIPILPDTDQYTSIQTNRLVRIQLEYKRHVLHLYWTANLDQYILIVLALIDLDVIVLARIMSSYRFHSSLARTYACQASTNFCLALALWKSVI